MAIFDIEYGSDNGPLEELLLSVDRPGDFYAHGRLFAPMPRLEVDGVGVLSFPVPEAQVGALIAAAERAPYGKGPDTLVDTSVRDCRQIAAARIHVSGGAWGDTFKRILDQAATGLGCPAERLDARLYKLLVYEPGGFFAAHRDTEKADGMIATLAIYADCIHELRAVRERPSPVPAVQSLLARRRHGHAAPRTGFRQPRRSDRGADRGMARQG